MLARNSWFHVPTLPRTGRVIFPVAYLSTLLLAHGATRCGAADFEAPVRLESEGEAIRVESPGYAAPCWTDIDKDGKKDLLVGQFSRGKIRIFKNLGEGRFGAGQWLQAEGQVAEIPGVW